jgi:transaldolase/glucose-6-phosphate isomerase
VSSIIKQLTAIGQSLWLDNIQRRALENGELKAMIERGDIRGMTSNPTIFNNAIAKSNDYDSALVPLAWSGWDTEKIFWELVIEDIRAATDLFQPLYEETNGGDGYVSIEVSPFLAHDTPGTNAQTQQLWARVARPNLMVKIPATKEGIPAIQKNIAAGININITLIFSLSRYAEVMEAYLSGLEERVAAGKPIDRIASVASFFVSRVDTKIDDRLPKDSPLRGKAAVANAKLAYEKFQQTFSGERWEALKSKGARIQRPLWASTSTKNPDYPDTLYVDNLIGPHTINTVPPQTLEAIRDHAKPEVTLTVDLDAARDTLVSLEAAGISMDRVTQELEDEGVKSFAESLNALFKTIEDKKKKAASQLGPLAASVIGAIARLEGDSVPARLWAHDPLLWTNDPAGQAEVKARMGWLDLPVSSRAMVREIKAFANEVHNAGFKKFLLLGMGGSSLAPEVLSRTFQDSEYTFAILDSTDPAQVLEAAKNFPPAETLYIVSSKSGGTAEVNAMSNYFWDRSQKDGSRFIAITDPGTSLETLARERSFRRIFNADPTVGGRYSALTYFGLVPAALMGLDPNTLLDNGEWMMRQSAKDTPAARNPGLVLGAVMGEAARAGRDKLTVLADASLSSIGSWLEQLIAESTGKQGRGIVPVDLEPVGKPSMYGQDRLFVYLRQTGELDKNVKQLRDAGHPVLEFPISSPYDLGAEFYSWEMATAVACHILGVNAFDQPDVQDAKDRTKAKIAEYQKTGKLKEEKPIKAERAKTALKKFLAQAKSGEYVAVNAYLPRNDKTLAALTRLRVALRNKPGCATTLGFGPRFLHSTGQLHKGGPKNGLFILITTDHAKDAEIPSQEMSFGMLEYAQALGDYEALAVRKRRVLRVHLSKPSGVRLLVEALK